MEGGSERWTPAVLHAKCCAMSRTASLTRTTLETDISLTLSLDG